MTEILGTLSRLLPVHTSQIVTVNLRTCAVLMRRMLSRQIETKEELYDATVLYYTEATKKSHLSTERVP